MEAALSQPDWNDALEWQKISAVKGVEFHDANLEALPSASHDSWLKEKSENGWVHGSVKDEELKTHPCMVKYDKLPADQKAKDFIFKAICTELLNHKI